MFVDFKNVDDANLALAVIHGHPFDAKHTFKVNRFSDIEKYAELDETYVEPELEEYTPRVWLRFIIYSVYSKFCCCHQEHLRAWLADPLGRDQYVTYRGDEVLISWHGKPSQCEIAHKPVRFFFRCWILDSFQCCCRIGRTFFMLRGHRWGHMLPRFIAKVFVYGVARHGSLSNALPIRLSN